MADELKHQIWPDGSGKVLQPPFKLYRRRGRASMWVFDIADSNGHLCSCENLEIALAILEILQKGVPNNGQ